MMAPPDWERVRALFHEAQALPAGERGAFVRARAGTDEALRREVESLLAADGDAAAFLSTPAFQGTRESGSVDPRFAPGSRLGAFEIVALIGVGGMGEVYRARDTRLDRLVAIKVLSAGLTSDARAHERFAHEARVISKLVHPHICTLYDIGTADAVEFLVMELLDGETLARRLERGALPVAEALKYAVEIANALTAAHAQGVVHRDLKPANIVLTKSGVKLLDFGLARLRASAARGRELPPGTMDLPPTAEGLVVGTLPYMAPEQLRGETVDARTDIFAFGAVLYEMIAGARPFAADSEAALIAAIIAREPPALSARQPSAPPALERLVATCMAKDPDARWQHPHDVALELHALAVRESTETPAVTAPPTTPPRRRAGWRDRLLAVSFVVLLGALGLVLWPRAPSGHMPAAPPNPQPVIVLMDSPLPGRVYDPRTLAAGGTNADDVSDVLRDLPVVTHKENTSPMWHREQQVIQQNPDLVVSHMSCLFDNRAPGDPVLTQHLADISRSRLAGVFGYVAMINPRTKFLVYTRGQIWAKEQSASWVDEMAGRFPQLTGRVFVMAVPGAEQATFRDPATADLLRARVKEILGLR